MKKLMLLALGGLLLSGCAKQSLNSEDIKSSLNKAKDTYDSAMTYIYEKEDILKDMVTSETVEYEAHTGLGHIQRTQQRKDKKGIALNYDAYIQDTSIGQRFLNEKIGSQDWEERYETLIKTVPEDMDPVPIFLTSDETKMHCSSDECIASLEGDLTILGNQYKKAELHIKNGSVTELTAEGDNSSLTIKYELNKNVNVAQP